MADLVNNLRDELSMEKARTSQLEDIVGVLQAQVSTLKKSFRSSHDLAEENHQYSRRQNLIIKNITLPADGTRETEDECMGKVQDVVSSLGITVPDEAFDRAHRVGKKSVSDDGVPRQAMIVRFTSWRQRTSVYRARKNNNNTATKISLDLTDSRRKLISKVSDNCGKFSNADFAFGDVNCNLCIRFKDNTYRHFGNLAKANELLEKFGGAEVEEVDDIDDENDDDNEDVES